MPIRGWTEVNGVNHYVLKNWSFLCDHETYYKGYKRDLQNSRPDSIMGATKSWCPECVKLYKDAVAIEKMRLDGVSEKPQKLSTLENRDVIEELNDTRRKSIDDIVDKLSAIHPANVPFVEVEDNLRTIELETRDKASELFDLLNGKQNY